MKKADDTIKRLGVDQLRELRAICWFCDSGQDGKYALIPSNRKAIYAPGGELHALVKEGCVRLLKRTLCKMPDGHYPALRMEQFGRNVLLRAKALQIDLSADENEAA